jgi:hypothetical protein
VTRQSDHTERSLVGELVAHQKSPSPYSFKGKGTEGTSFINSQLARNLAFCLAPLSPDEEYYCTDDNPEGAENKQPDDYGRQYFAKPDEAIHCRFENFQSVPAVFAYRPGLLKANLDK